MSQQQTKSYVFPLIIMGVAFFVIGFGVGINGIVVPILKDVFNLSNAMSYMVLGATFGAFLVFGPPSGAIIRKIGYKKTLVLALFIMALGMLLFVPSAKMSTGATPMSGFYMFLVASFVGGIGNALLQASVNPYVTICGPIEKAAQRMCLMGIMNKSAWYLGPMFISLFIDVTNVDISGVAFPFMMAAGVIAALAIFISFVNLPEIKAEGEDDSAGATDSSEVLVANTKKSVWQIPHLLLGALALFIYVGVETLPMASVIDFAKAAGLSNPASYSWIVPFGLVVGYVISLFVLQVMKQTKALILFTIIALIASLLLIFLPGTMSIYCLAGLGFSHSLMWGAIWALTITKLGKFTKAGSSMLVVAIVGGAVIPVIFGFIIDALKGGADAVATAANYQSAYWIFVPCYLYILWFALAGHKIGLTMKKK